MSNNENTGLRLAADASAKARTEEVLLKIRTAIADIEAEMEANDGLYPKGKLNQREVCRRAGIHFQTLQAPAHKKSTKIQVADWLSSKKTKTLAATKKAITDRADHWKAEHHKVATQIRLCKLELHEKELEVKSLRDEVETLNAQIAEMDAGKVKKLRSTNRAEK